MPHKAQTNLPTLSCPGSITQTQNHGPWPPPFTTGKSTAGALPGCTLLEELNRGLCYLTSLFLLHPPALQTRMGSVTGHATSRFGWNGWSNIGFCSPQHKPSITASRGDFVSFSQAAPMAEERQPTQTYQFQKEALTVTASLKPQSVIKLGSQGKRAMADTFSVLSPLSSGSSVSPCCKDF